MFQITPFGVSQLSCGCSETPHHFFCEVPKCIIFVSQNTHQRVFQDTPVWSVNNSKTVFDSPQLVRAVLPQRVGSLNILHLTVLTQGSTDPNVLVVPISSGKQSFSRFHSCSEININAISNQATQPLHNSISSM